MPLGRVEQRNRDRVEPKTQTQARIIRADKNVAVLTLGFDVPVVLRGTPAYTTDLPGITVLSAEAVSLTDVEITFSASIATATTLTIPVADPAIRTKVGGFVADTMYGI